MSKERSSRPNWLEELEKARAEWQAARREELEARERRSRAWRRTTQIWLRLTAEEREQWFELYEGATTEAEISCLTGELPEGDGSSPYPEGLN